MYDLLESIRKDLKAAVDPSSKDAHRRYFREEVMFYGVKAAPMHTIAKKHWQRIKMLDKSQLFLLCEQLLRSGWGEEAILVGLWMPKVHKKYTWEDIFIFRNWIDQYIDNWAECDTFCNHTMARFLERFPQAIREIRKWTASDNRWLQRAAAVSLIIPARKGNYLQDVFNIADDLLTSEDDMVQKGYGWMLKEASKTHMQEVYEFVLARRQNMPRTALRYAIEKMPPEMRQEAMKKETGA